MLFQIPFLYDKIDTPIEHHHKLYFVGSCFTEHIANYCKRAKISHEINSHGIVYNPASIYHSIKETIENKIYTEKDLFYYQEYWHSHHHHSHFSHIDAQVVLDRINTQITNHHEFLKQCDYLIITPGTSYAYYHLEKNYYVSNNHRLASQTFRKDLLEIHHIIFYWQSIIDMIVKINERCKIIFTVSPVRHLRDGVIENNRSKARLIESIHSLNNIYYFPSYELLMDVLRDYRYYDADMAHPNYQATSYIWEQFLEKCMTLNCIALCTNMDEIYKAYHHVAKNTNTLQHKSFCNIFYNKCNEYSKKYPYLDLTKEINHFLNYMS